MKISQLFLLHLRLPLINQTGEVVVLFLQELQRGHNLLILLCIEIFPAPRPGSRPSILVRIFLIASIEANKAVLVPLLLVILHHSPLVLKRACLNNSIKVVRGFGYP